MRVNLFATLAFLLAPLTKPVAAEVPKLVVSNFGAFLSSSNELKSHVAFTVVDPRPEYYLNTTCILSATDQHATVSLGVWKDCGDLGIDELSFWLGDDLRYLSLRRPWDWKDEDGSTYVIGVTDKQATNWVGSNVQTSGNRTTSTGGIYYSRTSDWEFPIHTIMS